jgi:hypothetical protein
MWLFFLLMHMATVVVIPTSVATTAIYIASCHSPWNSLYVTLFHLPLKRSRSRSKSVCCDESCWCTTDFDLDLDL